MQVYKAFFKVIYKNLPQIIIYIVVFVSVAGLLSNVNSSPPGTDFTETKVNIAFISYDESALSEGLRNHLSKTANMIDIPDDVEKLQDALFFREVEYIIKVPEGFGDSLKNGKDVQIEKTAVPGSVNEVYLDLLINKYINTAKIYINHMKGLSDERLVDNIEKDLSQKVEVKLNRKVEEVSKSEKVGYYYNYMTYSLFAVLILGVSVIMLVFNNKDLKMRNLCSPMTHRKMNFQLILGSLSYAVLAWVVMIMPSMLMYGSFMLSMKGMLLLLNSFVFAISALGTSFLIGSIVKGPGAVAAAANVVSLGTSFISGVFVPQELLGNTVLRIASFTPNYWYVKSNIVITGMADISMKSMTPVFYNMLIVLGFAVASLAVALVYTKQGRLSN